jgi:hypothetical protein
MLGQLLHSFNPSRRLAPRPAPPASDTETLHTKGLLFPDSTFLRDTDAISPSFPSLFPASGPQLLLTNDCSHGDLDLLCSRDIRIIVAQGETASLQPVLLFDSKLNPTTEATRLRHTRTGSRTENVAAHHTRTASGPPRQYGRQPPIESIPENSGRESPALPGGLAAAQHSRLRRASMSAAGGNDDQTPSRQKDSDETIKIALDCMFENVATTYKGSSNKIHIVPLDPNSKPQDRSEINATFGNRFENLPPKLSTVRRPSSLSSSYTAGDPPIVSPKQGVAIGDGPSPEHRRRTVLITRTFSVKWSDDDTSLETAPYVPKGILKKQNSAESKLRVPGTPPGTVPPLPPRRKPAPKPPTYAVTIVLQLPIANNERSPPPSRSGPPGLRRKGSGSQTGQASLGSSFDSERRTGWTMIDPFLGIESSALSFSSDVDDHVDLIGQHWDIILRTLNYLQAVVEEKALSQLKPLPAKGRPPKLLHLALANDEDIKKASDMSCLRVIRGIMIPRVRTGQGRWGIWREEARWLDKWTGGRERNTFFFNLISAFLGTHMEWLNIIGPESYRRRYREQQRATATDELAVPSRTIIVSTDKLAARRLIFLLAAFLPANPHSRGDSSPLRPSTSASFRAYSQSPPSHVPLSRHESLRRTINRRGKRSTSHQGSQSSRIPQPPNGPGTPDDSTETVTIRGLEDEQSSRRSSDAKSQKKSILTMSDADAAAQKSSATTSSTATPGAAMPVAHLVRKYSSSEVQGTVLPSTRDSPASETLLNALQRSNTGTSSSSESQSQGRWGSLKNFWSMSTRRDSSTEYSAALDSNDEGLGITGRRHSERLYGKLQQMVNEAEIERARDNDQKPDSGISSPNALPTTPDLTSQSPELQPTPSKSKPIDVPLKMSVNQQDGVIDVEIPFLSFDSPTFSPAIAGYHSVSSFGSYGQSSLISSSQRDTNHPMNVAGVLGKLHPDFELQGVAPYADLLSDLKATMRAEPNPVVPRTFTNAQPKDEWVDVCTSLIADTSTFTITRIRLRRHVRFLPPPAQPAGTPNLQFQPKSQYGNPYSNTQLAPGPTQITLEEKFEETKVNDLDVALVETIERVIAQSGSPSKTQSTASSRASSVRGRKGSLTGEDRSDAEVPHSECKKILVGALEQIATAVYRERNDAKKYGLARLRSLDSDVDSLLRAGIKNWFDEVDRNNKAIDATKKEKAKAEKVAAKEQEKEKENSDDASTMRPVQSLAPSPISTFRPTPIHSSEKAKRKELVQIRTTPQAT